MMDGARGRTLASTFAVFALALVVPFAVLTGIATKLYIDSEQSRLTAIGRLSSDRLRENVDRHLAEMGAAAGTLAQFADINSENLGAFDAQVRAVAKALGYTAGLSTLEGRHLTNTLVQPGQPLPVKSRPAIAEALVRTQRPVVSDVMVGATIGNAVISVNAPVLRHGKVTGILSVVANVDRFQKVISDAKIYAPHYAFILDRSGQVVAHTPGAPLEGKKQRYGHAPPNGAPDAGAEGFGDADTIEFSEPSALSGWTIVTGMPRSAFAEPLNRALALLAGVTALVIGLGALVSTAIARRAADDAQGLADAATKMARGERVDGARRAIREADVVGRALAAASNELADQRMAIARSQEELETRVRDRTRALEESRARYQAVTDNVSDVIVMWRRGDRAFSYVSPSCRNTFGSDAESLRILGPAGLLHAEDASIFEAIDEAFGSGRERVTRQFPARRRGGASIWIESVSSLVSTADPSEANVISVLRDITDRKNHAEALRLARDMAELAQAKAENANRSKSEFLAIVSYEIRTLLATVKGYAELLSDTKPFDAEQSRYMTQIEEATAIMLASVDDIVDFAEVEMGSIQLDPQPFALAPALDKVIAFLKPAAVRRGVTVGLTLEPGLPAFVSGDERRLRQVTLNLITAVLMSRRGATTHVSVKPDRTGAEPDRISITISSSGGSALHGPRTLGLTIAQRLIRLMEGTFEMLPGTAELSRCRFTCRLPEVLAPGSAGSDAAATTSSAASGGRILVVEEHVINQEAARAILRRAGYAVDIVGDGAAAIAAARGTVYDLVLLSLQLTGIDGLATARRIRALAPPAGDVPIVAMTAGDPPTGMHAVESAAIDGHVAMPLIRDRLIAAVRAHLSAVALVEVDSTASDSTLPTVFDRPSYVRLVEREGVARAQDALCRLVALIDAFHADAEGTSAPLAELARRLGFLDLAKAHEELATPLAGSARDAAILRCRVARDLAQRVFHELDAGAPGESASRVALV